MKPVKLNYRDLIAPLVHESRIISNLFEGNEKYERLIHELKKYDSDQDEFSSYPYQKDLVKIMEMPKPELMQLMWDLYEDFQRTLCGIKPYPILNTEIWLIIRMTNDSWVVGAHDLKYIPRVGETFTPMFIRNDFGCPICEVTAIEHEISCGVHSINVHLKDR